MAGAWLIPKTAENPTDRRYKPLGKPNFKEEHADLLILLLGNCVAYDIDIIKLTSEKLDRLLKMKARTDGNGHSRLITELEEKE